MVKVIRSFPAPESLATKAKKVNGSYDKPDVIERLKKDFHNKCYICEIFPKPPVFENHLEDTLAYSKRFYADRVSLLSADLGIEEKYKPIIEKHIKFLGIKREHSGFMIWR